MAANGANGLRFFQVKISNNQAQHLPGAIINKFFSKVEMIAGLGPEDSIPRCIARVEFSDAKSLERNDLLKDSFQIEKILLEGDGFAYVRLKLRNYSSYDSKGRGVLGCSSNIYFKGRWIFYDHTGNFQGSEICTR